MQRPGAAGAFQGLGQTGAPPPPYGGGYQSATPSSSSQWAPPAQNSGPGPAQQQWNQAAQQGDWDQQSSQAGGGYNPGTYGVMPGGYGQVQQEDQPPPPPPKPPGYPYSQNASYTGQGQQSGYSQQQSVFPNQGTIPQAQTYNTDAPPPPSQTPGGSYFPPSQGRPGSVYGIDQAAAYSTSQSTVVQQLPNTVLSPNEQNPAYVPPSLSGQGVTSYMPANTNPMPGVYVPPPPDIPAWQQATHAPLHAENKKFRYTKPSVDPSFYAQGYQPAQPQQFSQQQMQQPQFQTVQQAYGQQLQQDYAQSQGQVQDGQYAQTNQPAQHQFQHPGPQQDHYQRQLSYGQPQSQQYDQTLHGQQVQQHSQQYQQQGDQWQQTQPADRIYGLQQTVPAPGPAEHHLQQQAWQPTNLVQEPTVIQQQPEADIQAPKPLGRTGTTPPDFVNQTTPGPESQLVSPLLSRSDMNISSGRTNSVSSIALDAIRNQHQQAQFIVKSSSPAPSLSQQAATPPPLAPAGPHSRFSALGSGGPSDWERFANVDEEIDDEELFGAKKEQHIVEPPQPHSVELPASVPISGPSPPSTVDGWPTPLSQVAQTMPANVNHVAALKAKDDAIELLKANIEKMKAETDIRKAHAEIMKTNAEKEKTDLRAEVDRLRAELQSMMENSAGEKHALDEQIQALNRAAEQAKCDAESLAKENEAITARLKEDGEGKDDIIKERDVTIKELETTIADLTKQMADLTNQLEMAKLQEVLKPTPADLVPDLDPWYVGSLVRYIDMLKREYCESRVEDKIMVFTGFMEDEAAVRGLPYFSVPPTAAAVTPLVSEPVASAPAAPAPLGPESLVPEALAPEPVPSTPTPESTPTVSTVKPDIHIRVPEHTSVDDDQKYSPGGRPILHRAATSQSTTVLTPAGSLNDNDLNKTPTPVNSPPEPKPQYNAYVPPAPTLSVIETVHRQSLSFASPISVTPLHSKKTGQHDEIFFGETNTRPSNPSTQSQDSINSTSSDTSTLVPIPAPLSFKKPNTLQPPSPARAPAAPKKDTLTALSTLLHKTPILPPTTQPHPRLQALLTLTRSLSTDISPNLQQLTTQWEKSATATRMTLSAARLSRQEESESRTDDLFNSNEISYADIGDIEDDFKEKERKLKAQEDRDEYKSYVSEVFDRVYEGLQGRIKELMDAYFEVEGLARESARAGGWSSGGLGADGGDDGVEVIGDGDADPRPPSTIDTLHLLASIHCTLETLHSQIITAVAERDRRYKKTELQPLYAAGAIAKMKTVEKHFELAEKQAGVRAKADKAVRVGALVAIVEDIVVEAVGREQGVHEAIVDAVGELRFDGGEGDGDGDGGGGGGGVGDREVQIEVLAKAKETLDGIKESNKAMLSFFNGVEMELCKAVLEADVARAVADGVDAMGIEDIKKRGAEAEKVLREDLQRKLDVLDQDKDEVEELLREKGLGEAEGRGDVTVAEQQPLSADEERKRRMKAALEQARRRNGEVV